VTLLTCQNLDSIFVSTQEAIPLAQEKPTLRLYQQVLGKAKENIFHRTNNILMEE